MIGIVHAAEALVLAGHEPQEVGVVAGSGNGGVVAVGELDQLVVLDAVGLVDGAVGGVEALAAEALLGIEQEVVHFLGHALAGHVVHVMLVGREAGPVAGGAVGFADGELFGVGGAVDDEAGVALPGFTPRRLTRTSA